MLSSLLPPCKKAFSKYGLALHNLRHHRLFIPDCSQCGTAFDKASELRVKEDKASSKSGLDMHNLTHHRSFIHNFSECGTAFDKASEVTIHVEDIHKKTGRYCRVCGARANGDDVNCRICRTEFPIPADDTDAADPNFQ